MMARLRKSLNKGGIGHFTPGTRKAPFGPRPIYDESFGRHRPMREREYPIVEIPMSPDFARVILCSFEHALENGGWRAEAFRKWITINIGEMPVELVQKIESRLYRIKKSGSGITMTEYDYQEWLYVLEKLRRYLYDL